MRSTTDPRVAAFLRAAPQLDFDVPRFRAALAGNLLHAGERRPLHSVVDVGRLRIYRPTAATGLPVLVYLHGGAFVRGDLDAADVTCREVAARGPAVVVSVGYRLAPEHPYPAAVDDAVAAFRWALHAIAAHGGDPAAISIGGDSAGANLAAVAARGLSGEVRTQVLIAGVFDLADGLPPDAGEDQRRLDWVAGLYAGSTPLTDPRVSPLRRTDHTGAAPALVVTSDLDPFRDQAHRYAAALRAAAVPVELVQVPGLPHGFTNLAGIFGAEANAIYERVAAVVAGDTVRP